MKTRLLGNLSLFLFISLLAACGGGGGSSEVSVDNDVECMDYEALNCRRFSPLVFSIGVALDSSDDVFVGGGFKNFIDGEITFGIARLNNDSSYDTGFVTGTGFNNSVVTLAPASDGSGDVYVGGYFTGYDRTGVGHIARLNLDGSLDTDFDTGIGLDDAVLTIVSSNDSSGDVYVGGSFTSYNGTVVGDGLIRLNDDGSLDSGFKTGSGWGKYSDSIAPAIDGSGDVYVARSSSPGIARLNNDGSIDAGFDTGLTGFNDQVNVIAVATDGSGDVYVGGNFSDYNGVGTAGIVRLNSDGSLDMGFVAGPQFEGSIHLITLAIDGSGDIYADTKTQGIIRRLNNDGSIDAGFDTGSGFNHPSSNSSVTSIALATDGSGDVYIGGYSLIFTYNSTVVDNLVRLTQGGVLVSGALSFLVGGDLI